MRKDPKVVLLGARGYVGRAFENHLREEGAQVVVLSRSEVDYSQFPVLLQFLNENRPDFLINCAGYTGKPNVDACETARAETLAGNALLPQTVGHACAAAGVSWGHVSSGCIYNGAHVWRAGRWETAKDLTRPELWHLAMKEPNQVKGFKETDAPNFSFRDPPCSFYSGSKALGEETLKGLPGTYIWRLRIPFDQVDNPRNYITKLLRYPRLYNNLNSLSHLGDFAAACYALHKKEAPFGIYNVTNPGFVSTEEVVSLIQEQLHPAKEFKFFANDDEFYTTAAKTPRSNCILDTQKLLAQGIEMRPVREALTCALQHWTTQP